MHSAGFTGAHKLQGSVLYLNFSSSKEDAKCSLDMKAVAEGALLFSKTNFHSIFTKISTRAGKLFLIKLNNSIQYLSIFYHQRGDFQWLQWWFYFLKRPHYKCVLLSWDLWVTSAVSVLPASSKGSGVRVYGASCSILFPHKQPFSFVHLCHSISFVISVEEYVVTSTALILCSVVAQIGLLR